MIKYAFFSADGQFTGTILKKGNGPQEFGQIDAWAVDANEEFFIYHDVWKNNLFKYNLASHRFETSIPFEDHGYLSKMIMINDTTLSILPMLEYTTPGLMVREVPCISEIFGQLSTLSSFRK